MAFQKLSPRLVAGCCFTMAATAVAAVPGTLRTDWIGNTFGMEMIDSSKAKDDLMNRAWVQNYIANIWTSRDGKVFAYSNWDEGSRTCGIYKDGKVLGQLDFGKDLFGQNGDLVGDDRYVYTTTGVDWGNWERHGFGIQRYTHDGRTAGWTGGRGYLNSYLVVRDSGANPSISRLAIDTALGELYLSDSVTGGVLVLDVKSMSQTPKASWKLDGIDDMVADQAGSLWILRKDRIQKYGNRGAATGIEISNLAAPTRLSMDNLGRLLVFDDSTLQVHIFADLATTPREAGTLGTKNGIYSGMKGKVAPDKLLPKCAGLGTDSVGNIYLAWGGVPPVAGSDIRSYTAAGSLKWQVLGHTFVACGGFDPASDGQDIYFRDYHYSMDYTKAPGKGQRYESFHWDRVNDTPSVFGGSVVVRHLGGKTILASTASDQMSGGFRFYRIEDQLATPAGILADGSWAWWIEPNGNVWNADGSGRIKRFPFLGLDAKGNVRYDQAHPDTFPRPTEVWGIQRIHYDSASDALYVTGYDQAHPAPNEWGRTGTVFSKYSNWTKANRQMAWKTVLPLDNRDANIGDATLKDMWVEGEYAFFVTCNSTPATTVYVFALSDGHLVGTILPGPEIAGDIAFYGTYGSLGWVDMAWGIQAFKRANGEYQILVEDDLHAKNVFYHWCPSGTCDDPVASAAPKSASRSRPSPLLVNLAKGRVELGSGFDLFGRLAK
jgi:nitrous oxide reductase accessory protein NosL